MKRMPLLLTLLALVALSASVAYWVLQLYKPDQRPLAAAPVMAAPPPSVDAAATLFGGQAMAAVATNYQLTGVVAAGRNSVAILIADGQPAKAFPIGKELSAGVVVKEVHPRYVMLSEGGILKRIELAVDAKPPADMTAPLPMEAPAPPAYPQQGQPPPQQPLPQTQQERPMPQSPQQQEEPPQGPGQEQEPPPPPVPMGRPTDAVPAPAPQPEMPPPTRNVGVQGPPPVSQ